MAEWLVSKEKARNRPEALVLAAGLLNEGFLLPTGDLAKDAAESADQTVFSDDPDALYYFVSSDEGQNRLSSTDQTNHKSIFLHILDWFLNTSVSSFHWIIHFFIILPKVVTCFSAYKD